MKVALLVTIVCAGLPVARVSVSAHHSVTAELSEQNRVTLTGTITKVEWVNPHGRIHLDVKGPNGQVAAWTVETGSPQALSARGLTKTDVRVGTTLVVDGYRAAKGTTTAVGRIARLADGTEFFIR